MTDPASPREKLLDAAERLFTLHGYAGVRLRDLEQAAGLHHSTFYHHAPGGKAQLFVEALERSLTRHEAALNARVTAHHGDLRQQLYAAAEWVLANPSGNHLHVLTTDLPRLPADDATRLSQRAFASLIGPIARALREAREAGQAQLNPDLAETVAGALLASLQALQAAAERYPDGVSATTRARDLIDVLLLGLLPRRPPNS